MAHNCSIDKLQLNLEGTSAVFSLLLHFLKFQLLCVVLCLLGPSVTTDHGSVFSSLSLACSQACEGGDSLDLWDFSSKK
jgi:hypothetical protein